MCCVQVAALRQQFTGDVQDEDCLLVESAVVTLRNIHFRSTIADIVEFFRGYDPIPDSVNLEYTSGGRLTGHGSVVFCTLAQAQRAVTELDRKSLHGWSLLLQRSM